MSFRIPIGIGQIVAVDQSTVVHVDGTVELAKDTKVKLDGVPTVAVSSLPAVTIGSLPAVQLAAGQSVVSTPAGPLTAKPATWRPQQLAALNALPALLAACDAAEQAFTLTSSTGTDVDQVKADLLALVQAQVTILRTY